MREPFYHIDTFKPRISVGYLLRHTSKLCGARIETMFDDADVSFTQWIALALIHGEIADTCSRLARGTKGSASSGPQLPASPSACRPLQGGGAGVHGVPFPDRSLAPNNAVPRPAYRGEF